MAPTLVLASGSEIRQTLLRNAGVCFEVLPSRIDEASVKAAMLAEAAPPRDIADELAEMKARKTGMRRPASLVLGCDQILSFNDNVLAKPASRDDAEGQLRRLRGKTHQLLSAAVIHEDGQPVWRHVGTARLTMRDFSDRYLEGYLDRNWADIRHSVGGYQIEAEGVRLFSRIQGDYFCILGLPLQEILVYLGIRGVIET